MDEHIIEKMEKDISELSEGQSQLKVDVAVIGTNVQNIGNVLEKYIEQKEKVDTDQNSQLVSLDRRKADKVDIDKLASTIKWATGLLTTVGISLVTYILSRP